VRRTIDDDERGVRHQLCELLGPLLGQCLVVTAAKDQRRRLHAGQPLLDPVVDGSHGAAEVPLGGREVAAEPTGSRVPVAGEAMR
jgi:hypothetical protein